MSDLKPIVISGPSGCGKSTLLNKLFEEYPDSFGFSVSHTTRVPRVGEENGRHYHFVTKDDITVQIANGEFIESAEFSGNIYGTSKKAVQDVLDQNRVCILDVDEQGVRSMKKVDLDPVYIFIKPPSMDELRKRLLGRGTETESSAEKRMQTATSAIEYSEETGVYDFVLVNDDLEVAYAQLKGFIFTRFPSLKPSPTLETDEVPKNYERQESTTLDMPNASFVDPQSQEGTVWDYCSIL